MASIAPVVVSGLHWFRFVDSFTLVALVTLGGAWSLLTPNHSDGATVAGDGTVWAVCKANALPALLTLCWEAVGGVCSLFGLENGFCPHSDGFWDRLVWSLWPTSPLCAPGALKLGLVPPWAKLLFASSFAIYSVLFWSRTLFAGVLAPCACYSRVPWRVGLRPHTYEQIPTNGLCEWAL